MDSKGDRRKDAKSENDIGIFKSISIAFLFFILGIIAEPSYKIMTYRQSVNMTNSRDLAEKRNDEVDLEKLTVEKIIGCTKGNLNDFLHEEPVTGFHIFCFEEDKSVDNELVEPKSKFIITAYSRATESGKISWAPEEYTWDSFEKKFISIMSAKGVKQSKWAFFNSNGESLALAEHFLIMPSEELKAFMLNDLFSSKMALLVEGGTWFWPGVRIGFKRKIQLSASNTSSGENKQSDRVATLETLSIDPLVLSVEGFLSIEESNYIQKIAGPQVQHASGVSLMDADAGKEDSEFRTSQSAFINSETDPMLQEFEIRTAQLTRTPLQHQELYQILKYGKGQKYDAHLDYFDISHYRNDQSVLHLTKNGKQNRFATVFFYLSDVEKGGETVFPRFNKAPQPYDMADCTKGLKVKPQKGKVIIFYSIHPNGDYNPYSLHGACPVEEGIKWAGNKWIWNAPINFVSHK